MLGESCDSPSANSAPGHRPDIQASRSADSEFAENTVFVENTVMRRRASIFALVFAAVTPCCGPETCGNHDDGQALKAAHEFRENLARQAVYTWGERNIRVDSLRGPDDALLLDLRGADGSCTEPAVHLFILNSFGPIRHVKTITCREANNAVTVEVAPYAQKIRATFPMIPDRPDTHINFGGTVTEMSPANGHFKRTRFASRQEIVDYLQIEPRALQFGVLHEHGIRIAAATHDDRILVVETTRCDSLEWRAMFFSSLGGSRTTMVKWTGLGGTFMVCKGTRDMGLLGMRAALESIELSPVNSPVECTRRQIMDRCN